MIFTVTAKQYGNSVQFVVIGADEKEALEEAHRKANSIFEYTGIGDQPTVSVKER